jgi:hypothetical protein
MKTLRKLRLFVTACFLLACIGCVSLVETTGQALDGSVPAEKREAVYSTGKKKRGAAADMELWNMLNKAGERSIVIKLGRYPAMKIRGTAPNADGIFNLVSLDYLGGNTQGWNEYRLDLAGSGELAMSADTAILSITGEVEPVQISWGRIRRYDTRITGADALANLRNRRERILALVEWMQEREETPPPGMELKDFEKYWKPILFPEISPAKKRPDGWQQEGDAIVKADDIRWNAGYTERTFTETLKPIRDSGTMLRDWEEAADWIFMEYEWPRILEALSRETVLFRQKR